MKTQNGKISNSYIENARVDLYSSSTLEIFNSTLVNSLADKPNMNLTGNAGGTLYLSNVNLQGYNDNLPSHVVVTE